MCVCVCVHVHARMRAYVCVCVLLFLVIPEQLRDGQSYRNQLMTYGNCFLGALY